MSEFTRPVLATLKARMAERPQRLQILAGPRQVGKTTLVRQMLRLRDPASHLFWAADQASDSDLATQPSAFITQTSRALPSNIVGRMVQIWRAANEKARQWQTQEAATRQPFVLVIDEVQTVPQWSSHIKGLFDEAVGNGLSMHVLLLGSAPLLVQQGLSESLLGRYELLRVGHWSFAEMHEAFDYTLDEYIYFGSYPGSASYRHDVERWQAFIRGAYINPSIEKDVLAMARVDKKALLRQVFELGCLYSGQIVALQKMVGQMHSETSNTTTLSHHLTLLDQAGLLRGLQKYSGQAIRQRSSPPKFQVHNNALQSALAGYNFEQAQADRSHWGRLAESAVGAHLLNTAAQDTSLHYWREENLEVDFVLRRGHQMTAIEVKTEAGVHWHRGLARFCELHPECKRLIVGSDDLPLGEFLLRDAQEWL